MRIGFGSDTHKLVQGKPLIIGGISIDSPTGAEAHSDGDVLIHALIDALLGAAAAGDIGKLFPPEDSKWKDANSMDLLEIAIEKVRVAGFSLGNIDSVIHLEKPSLKPYKNAIQKNLADFLLMDTDHVSIKAKTAEGLGPVGLGESLSAEVVVLLEKTEPDAWV
ncbi:MAG: 2-C-methyl-D-erythritol 2,4-cyclodiphosphate synthase [Bacteroidetes bacterium]|nr:2-C-methyl-D-erythritol 2,4-cyclodiphosphate synthase [Bacteroidota bacterium]